MNVLELGQVFTPTDIVDEMIALKQNNGRTLEPSAGDGAFFNKLTGDKVGIEIDEKVCPSGCLCKDFFDYPTSEKFDTIIGNPPYVGYKSIGKDTIPKLNKDFDKRTNLYIFFIDKCLDHLNPKGELIFITPREFLKATCCMEMNKRIYDTGTITHFYDLGDIAIFKGYSPNCVIWRFGKDDYSRKTNYQSR